MRSNNEALSSGGPGALAAVMTTTVRRTRRICRAVAHAEPRRRPMPCPITGPASMSVSTAATASAAPTPRRRSRPAVSTPRAALSAAPLATTSRWARRCSASKATRLDAYPTAARLARSTNCKPATTGSLPRAAALATRSIASCPCYRRRGFRRHQEPDLHRASSTANEAELELFSAAGLEAALAGPSERQARISLCRSRPRRLRWLRCRQRVPTPIWSDGVNYRF